MYRVQATSAYLVDKDGNKLKLGDSFYKAVDINGYKSVNARVLLTNTETGEKKTLFPGEYINEVVPKKKRIRKKKET